MDHVGDGLSAACKPGDAEGVESVVVAQGEWPATGSESMERCCRRYAFLGRVPGVPCILGARVKVDLVVEEMDVFAVRWKGAMGLMMAKVEAG